MIDEVVAIDVCIVESVQMAAEAIHDSDDVHCILNSHGIRSGVALSIEKAGSNGCSSRHDETPQMVVISTSHLRVSAD